jgi:hypothetical protein
LTLSHRQPRNRGAAYIAAAGEFAAQYAIAVAVFRHPEAQTGLAVAGHAVSGTSVGYFIGWMIAFRRRYRAAPDAARSVLESAPAAMVRNS